MIGFLFFTSLSFFLLLMVECNAPRNGYYENYTFNFISCMDIYAYIIYW